MIDPILQRLLAERGWITEAQIAALEGVKEDSVVQRRSRGQMPPYFKAGYTVCYKWADYADMIEAKATKGGGPSVRNAWSDLLDAEGAA